MMRTRRAICTIAIIATLCGTCGALRLGAGADEPNLVESKRMHFLTFDKDEKDNMFAPYAAFPDGAKSVDVPGMEKVLYWSAQRVFKKCPSAEYIKRNLVCVPHEEFAKTNGINADVVFLRFSDGDDDFMLVVAGGLIGSVYIFDCPVKEKIEGAHLTMKTQFLGETIAQQGNAIAIMRRTPELTKVYKMPASAPLADRWFEWVTRMYPDEKAPATRPSTQSSTRPAADPLDEPKE